MMPCFWQKKTKTLIWQCFSNFVLTMNKMCHFKCHENVLWLCPNFPRFVITVAMEKKTKHKMKTFTCDHAKIRVTCCCINNSWHAIQQTVILFKWGGVHKLRWHYIAHYWPPTYPLFLLLQEKLFIELLNITNSESNDRNLDYSALAA